MGCNPSIPTAVGVALAFLSWISSLLAFFLPHWVEVDETLVAPKSLRIDSNEMVRLQYNYGFWKYCSSMTSSTLLSRVCGDIVTHQVWEQIIICMVLLAAILHLSSILTSSLFLLVFDDEPVCLYVAGTSMGIAGMLLLTTVLTYGTQNRNIIDVTATYIVPFKTSHLGASFWCATSSCIVSFVICIMFLAATIHVGSRSFRHGIPLNNRRRFRRYRRGQSLEMTRAIGTNQPRGEDDNMVSLYRTPAYNAGSSIFDLHLKDAAEVKGVVDTTQRVNNIGNGSGCCNERVLVYGDLREDRGNIRSYRNDDSSGKYMSDLQNNLNHPFGETSNELRYTDHFDLCFEESNRNNDALFAQISGLYEGVDEMSHIQSNSDASGLIPDNVWTSGRQGNDFNIPRDSTDRDLVHNELKSVCEQDHTSVGISQRNVVAQAPSECGPKFAWTDTNAQHLKVEKWLNTE